MQSIYGDTDAPGLGIDFVVLLDTGSTDLWVDTSGRNVKFTNTTDLVTGVVFGSGQVSGNITFAEVKLGEYTIPSQGMSAARCIAR